VDPTVSGHFEKAVNLVPLLGLEPQFLRCAAHSPIILLTTVPWAHYTIMGVLRNLPSWEYIMFHIPLAHILISGEDQDQQSAEPFSWRRGGGEVN